MEQSKVFTVPTPLLALPAEIAAEGERDLGNFFFLPLIPFFPSSPVLQFVSPPGLNLSERRMVKGAEKVLTWPVWSHGGFMLSDSGYLLFTAHVASQ